MQSLDLLKILNILNFFLPLVWLAFIFAYFIKRREINVYLIKSGILSTVTIFAFLGAFDTITTYNLWSVHPISRFLLPPHLAITYFYQYSFNHYWIGNIANIVAGLAWAGILFVLYKYSHGRFLDKSDIWLGLFTALIVGWPKFIAYLIFAFGLLLFHQIVNSLVYKDKNPIPITHSLIVGALIVIILGNFFISRLGLEALMF